MFIMAQNKTKLNAFICHVHKEIEKYHLTVTGSCYLVTCFFVILRVSLFAWLPELQTLHGVTIVAYLGNFVVGYMLLGIKKLFMYKNNISREICVVLSIITYFSIMSAFFWRNIMCFDMWRTFSGKHTISRRNKISRPRLAAYFAYAVGVPAGLTAILIAMEFSDISNYHPLKPKLRLNGCAGMSGDGALVYHFTPLITLFFANIVMFTSTALKIAATTKQTKILYQSQSNVTNATNTERQRFLLYVKLWAAMLILEVNWIVRAVVYFFPEVEVLVFFVDIYNTTVLLGLIIHYFCQKRNWRKIKMRYQQMRGIAVSEPNTGTSSNRTMSTTSLEVSQISVTNVSNTVTSNCDTSPL
ncbi:unnamed protein product [Spodoptera littoralis]|uniref:Uncharacterized protein n=1 Tax=Spodoptera littoralis TaxID=7109 RepID=A0A9P0MYT4_SPOLI|nr:unnamed protein product [Spodoptera littoralis]CAH1638357.1 unnamed protein product [Spodoptera littoralis]